jgi:hypothetical protein
MAYVSGKLLVLPPPVTGFEMEQPLLPLGIWTDSATFAWDSPTLANVTPLNCETTL